MDAKLDFNVFHSIFLIFTVLNSRFSENNTKSSQTGSQKLEGAFRTGSSLSLINLSRLGSFIDSYPNGKAETSREKCAFVNVVVDKYQIIFLFLVEIEKVQPYSGIRSKAKCGNEPDH